ncbi:MAG: methyltransferase domain-containing protein [Dermatophilaceae bacterium]
MGLLRRLARPRAGTRPAHHGPGHADAQVGHLHGVIEQARFYDLVTKAAFLGRRGAAYRRLAGLAAARPGDRVLDLGCGTGALTEAMTRAVGPGGSVLGIDPSEPMCRHAARAVPGATFRVMGAEALDLPDRSVDVVVSALAVHHVADAARSTAFAEAARVLRPGGRLMVADFRPPTGRLGALVALALAGHAMGHDPGDELVGLARGAGLQVLDVHRVTPFSVVVARRPAQP